MSVQVLFCAIKQPRRQEFWCDVSEITFHFSPAVLTENAYYNVSDIELQWHQNQQWLSICL